MIPSVSENSAILYIVNNILKPSTSLFLLISVLLLLGLSIDSELRVLLSNTDSKFPIRYFNYVGPIFMVVVSILLASHKILRFSQNQWDWLIKALNHFVGLWAFSMSILFCQIVFTFIEIGLSDIGQFTLGLAVSILFLVTLLLPAPLIIATSAICAVREGSEQWGLFDTNSKAWTLAWMAFAAAFSLAIWLG